MDALDPEEEPGIEPQGRRLWPRWMVLLVGALVCLGPCAFLTGTLLTTFTPPSIRKKAKHDIVAIASAVDQYAIENDGKYPESLEVLIRPDENGISYVDWPKVPRDPWNQEYQYEPPRPGTDHYRVFTLGSDGVPGGEGNARDIDNLMIRRARSETRRVSPRRRRVSLRPSFAALRDDSGADDGPRFSPESLRRRRLAAARLRALRGVLPVGLGSLSSHGWWPWSRSLQEPWRPARTGASTWPWAVAPTRA